MFVRQKSHRKSYFSFADSRDSTISCRSRLYSRRN